jgi:hypothetical protein
MLQAGASSTYVAARGVVIGHASRHVHDAGFSSADPAISRDLVVRCCLAYSLPLLTS